MLHSDPDTGSRSTDNQQTYSRDDVVDHYVRASELMPAERYLFPKYVQAGLAVLDVGVGGGRTTPYLAPQASRYLGIDYAAAMVEACRRRFPDLEFAVGDATHLEGLADAQFDIAIFSFNGIDSIATDEARIAALAELKRVVRPSGHIIISSHNARLLAPFPNFEGATPARKIWRIARAFARTMVIAPRALMSGTFRKGHGYISDRRHGGLRNHVSSPASVARDAQAAGLRIVERVGGLHPRRLPAIMNPWDTYVLARR